MKDFQAKERDKPSLLNRKRPIGNPQYICFSADDQSFEAYIHVNVLKFIYEAMQKASPHETYGLLGGRACQDNKKVYTLIQEATVAHQDELENQATGFVRISGEGQKQVRIRMEQKHPTLEIMGWFHTHPTTAALYSYEDKEEQKTWPHHYHIGIVMGGNQYENPIAVFSGPNSIPLFLSHGVLLPILTSSSPPQKTTPAKPIPPPPKQTKKMFQPLRKSRPPSNQYGTVNKQNSIIIFRILLTFFIVAGFILVLPIPLFPLLLLEIVIATIIFIIYVFFIKNK